MQATFIGPRVNITAHLGLLAAYKPCGGSSALHLLALKPKPTGAYVTPADADPGAKK